MTTGRAVGAVALVSLGALAAWWLTNSAVFLFVAALLGSMLVLAAAMLLGGFVAVRLVQLGHRQAIEAQAVNDRYDMAKQSQMTSFAQTLLRTTRQPTQAQLPEPTKLDVGLNGIEDAVFSDLTMTGFDDETPGGEHDTRQ